MVEWRETSIDGLGRVVTGTTPRSSEDEAWGDDIDFITPSDQRDGMREMTAARRLSRIGARRFESRTIPARSTCFTCIGSTIGKVTWTLHPAVTNQQINSVVPNTDVVDEEFLYYLLRYYSPRIRQIASGSATPIINRTRFGQFRVRAPAKSHQQAIGRLLGALDDKIAGNDRITATARELAKTLYQNFVRVGEISAIGDVAAVFDGPHATPTKTATGPWFLSISSLQDGVLDLAESVHLSEQDFIGWTRRITPQMGDVLFSYETRLGSAALMPGSMRACLGRRMALLRPRDGAIGSATLLHAYLSEEFQETVARRAIHGATVDRIPLTELSAWPITLPPQERRDTAEGLLGALHRRIEAGQRESQTLAELRDTLLPKLMSGELRIRDAERHVEGSPDDRGAAHGGDVRGGLGAPPA